MLETITLDPSILAGNHKIKCVFSNGAMWLFAEDICRALKLSNPGAASHTSMLDSTERRTARINTPSGRGGGTAILISESGLYKMILRSNLPEAKPYQDWVTKEVLLSIRRTSTFVAEQPSIVENPSMTDLDLLGEQERVFRQLLDEINAYYEQALEEEAAPTLH